MLFRYAPKHWRDRAEEMRRFAGDAKNESAREMMLRIADDYDKLAARTTKTEPAPGGQSSAI